MTTIVTRSVKGSPLSHAEMDANLTNLNTDKLEASTTATLTNKNIPESTNTLEFIPNGAGAVATTVQTKLRESVSIKDFGAAGDGVANDQGALEAAVAACYLSGEWLYWPDGTYISTASIPNFHDVYHYGPGVVKRNSDMFKVSPTAGAINNLYVSTVGNNTNDGLSAAQPKATVQSAGDCIYGYQYGDSNWVINLAAGTYVEKATFFSAFPTPNRVQFAGPAVARGVQPTAIMQAPSHALGVSTQGIYCQNNVRFQVSNINFKDYVTNAAPDANELSSGIVADTNCEIYTDNVWADNCDMGVYVANGSQIRLRGGRFGFNAVNGAGAQIIRHSRGTIGYAGTAADITGATGPAFIGGAYGVMLQEMAMAHTDTCYFSAQTLAGVFVTTSRVHSVSSTYDTCAVGIEARYNANLGDTSNTFISCGTDKAIRSGSRYAGSVVSEGLDDGPPVKEMDVVGGSTSSTSPVTLFTKSFIADELKRRAAGFKLKLYGEVVGVAGTKTFTITFGATTLKTYTIAASTTNFEINVELFNVTAATSQKCMTRKIENGVLGVTDLNVTIAENLTAAKTLTVTYNVNNAADLCRVGIIDLEIQH